MKKIKLEQYLEKNPDYYNGIRREIFAFLPKKIGKILDIGCGSGNTLVEIKKIAEVHETVGIDIVERPGTKEKIDKYFVFDVEEKKIPFSDGYFDVVISTDTLEHLINPWNLMDEINRILKLDGLFVGSLPNIRHYQILSAIFLKGDFSYSEAGVLDKSHLRFFCKKNMIDMFENSGFEILKQIPKIGGKKAILNRLTFSKFEELLVIQYLFLLKKRKLVPK